MRGITNASGEVLDDYTGVTVDAGGVMSDNTYIYLSIPAEGKYDETSKVRTPNSNLNIGILATVTLSDTCTCSSGAQQHTHTKTGTYTYEGSDKAYCTTENFRCYLTRVVGGFNAYGGATEDATTRIISYDASTGALIYEATFKSAHSGGNKSNAYVIVDIVKIK